MTITSAVADSGLVVGLRALLGKELRSRSRGWRPIWLLTGYLGALALATAGLLALSAQVSSLPPTIGAMLFSALATGSVLLLAFITPALTTGSISGERERRTLDLLIVTRASALGIAAGKLAGSLLYVFFLLAASLPAFAIVYLFVGVPPAYLGGAILVAAATSLAHASIGLLLSAVLKRSALASVLTYLVVIVLVFGLPFVATVLASIGWSRGSSYYGSSYAYGSTGSGIPYASYVTPRGSPPPAYVYASPITAVNSVLPFGFGGGMLPIGGSGTAGSGAGIGVTSTYVVRSDAPTGESDTVTLWAPWLYYGLFSVAVSLLCVLGAALAIAPIKPWSTWRIRGA